MCSHIVSRKCSRKLGRVAIVGPPTSSNTNNASHRETAQIANHYCVFAHQVFTVWDFLAKPWGKCNSIVSRTTTRTPRPLSGPYWPKPWPGMSLRSTWPGPQSAAGIKALGRKPTPCSGAAASGAAHSHGQQICGSVLGSVARSSRNCMASKLAGRNPLLSTQVPDVWKSKSLRAYSSQRSSLLPIVCIRKSLRRSRMQELTPNGGTCGSRRPCGPSFPAAMGRSSRRGASGANGTAAGVSEPIHNKHGIAIGSHGEGRN